MKGKYTPLFVLIPIFIGVVYVFWTSDLQNRIGSKRIDIVPIGSKISNLHNIMGPDRQVIHFYDDDCIFAKKNIGHLKILQERYRAANLKWTLMVPPETDSLQLIRTLGFNASIVRDNGEFAKSLGVAMIPQMVIVDRGEIYYRGNYTKNGAFCGADNILSSDPGIALKALAESRELPIYLTKQSSYVGCPF